MSRARTEKGIEQNIDAESSGPHQRHMAPPRCVLLRAPMGVCMCSAQQHIALAVVLVMFIFRRSSDDEAHWDHRFFRSIR